MDLLGEVLLSVKIEANSIGVFHASESWGFSMPQLDGSMAFAYSVIGSPCWLLLPGEAPKKLNQGDSALVLNGAVHALASHPDAEQKPLLQHWLEQGLPPDLTPGTKREAPLHFGFDADNSTAQLLTIAYVLRSPSNSPLLSILPDTIVLLGSGSGVFPWLPATLDFLAAEHGAGKPGYLATSTHLAELIFSSFLRAHILSAPRLSPSWLRGLSDAGIGRALTAIHDRPQEAWTLPLLASEAGMSRATFARRFQEAVGQTPTGYLLSWRMHMAAERIVARKEPIGSVAERVGYSSEAAFRHAFKRKYGLSPLKYARENNPRP